MYTKVTNCRACGTGRINYAPGIKAADTGATLATVFSLGIQPLANDFVAPGGEHQGFAPLEVLICPKCGLAQLSVVVRPEILYGGSYLYVTSKSNMMQEHFRRLWEDCSKLATSKTVVEIGSNDGSFLEYCLRNGAERVMGIEPAVNLAEAAREKGITTICDFFGPDTGATTGLSDVGIIFARHVFCHVDNWRGFMRNLESLAGDNTLICIEAPYAMDQLAANSFDQIYHEHLSYLSIRAVVELLNGGPFQLESIRHYPIHGGAVALFIRRRSAGFPVDPSVKTYLDGENLGPDIWKAFGVRAYDLISNLRMYVRNLASDGKRVVGFGASAKSTVWINACGFTHKDILAVYDCTPEKWYRYIPGTNIPVVHEGSFYADAADYAVLFAWNFAAEVLEKQKNWMQGGGKFIVPVPRVRVIGVDSDTGGA